MKLYVGNLAHEATEDDLREAFAALGEVKDVNIVQDKQTGDSRGFGFVEMPSQEEARAAIEAMDGKAFMERELKVQESKPKPSRGGGFGSRGGGGGGGGGGQGGRSPRRFGGDGNRSDGGSGGGGGTGGGGRRY